jgi:hypothetical protein
MTRKTDISEINFEVLMKPVYTKKKSYSELGKYMAVIGILNKKETVFSVVSKNYFLISNTDAIKLGKKIFSEFFPSAEENSLKIFNINYPQTKSFCNIDIANCCHVFNIWEKEVYVPFMRITNSYNRTKTLRFETGFCRMLCDNGVIFEKETVKLNYTHYKKSLTAIQKNITAGSKTDKLKELETEFTNFMKNLNEIKINKDYFIPITAKIFGLKFNLKSKSEKQRANEYKRMQNFKIKCGELTEKYVKELGENAYSVFNTATEYANSRELVKSHRYNDYQVKAGEWLKGFSKRDRNETLEMYLEDYKYLIN